MDMGISQPYNNLFVVFTKFLSFPFFFSPMFLKTFFPHFIVQYMSNDGKSSNVDGLAT